MTFLTIAIVLFAALLHAFWNAVVKGAGDKTIALGMVALGHVVPGVAIVLTLPPPNWAALPFIIASTVIHWVYYWLLNKAYALGDLSLIYPIARGLAPVLIALGAQFWVGERLPVLAWIGILSVSAGIMVLTKGLFSGLIPTGGIVAAVGVAIMVASYSLVDGVGVRLSGNALAYIGWLFAAEFFVAAFIFATRFQRLIDAPAKSLWLGFLGGVVSGAAYGLVLYAKTIAPLGIVSALRETSVIFAAMIGVMWFGEGPRRNRIIAAIIVAFGIVIISAA